MKNLVIRSGSLRMGGLERVLIEMLQGFNLKKYNISLIIEDDSGKENIFLTDIPKGIDLYFLKSQELIKRTHYHRENKKNIGHKILYNYFMFKEHKIVLKETKNVLEIIIKKYGEIDVFIDYDWGARRYVEKLNVKKKIVWIHNSIPKLLKKDSKIKRFGKNLNKYDLVIAICDEMKEEIESIYPYLKCKVKRIYNPFNFKRIFNLAKDDTSLTIKEKELLNDDYVVAVSRLDTVQKDYETLILGYKESLKEGVNEKLYIVGDGPDREKIKKLVKENNLEKNIIFIGKTKNPYVWMKNSKYFVHSSKYEGFGLVLVEAMSLGKCIISSDCKVGPKEILNNGEYGKLFKVGQIDELKLMLLLMSKNIQERKKYEEFSLKRKDIFSVNVISLEIEKLVDGIN